MGGGCCKMFRIQRADEDEQNERLVVDLREDRVSTPMQCVDAENCQVEHNAQDLIDLRENVIIIMMMPPVQCTEP